MFFMRAEATWRDLRPSCFFRVVVEYLDWSITSITYSSRSTDDSSRKTQADF